MRLRFFGGFAADTSDGAPLDVRGGGQRAVLFRLALDAGTTVGYRALAEDVWPHDEPDDPRASLQSLVSRLRRALPPGVLRAEPGGYALDVARADVDLARFADLVAAARAETDADAAARSARDALALWHGEPWTPDGFDWVVRDLLEDRAHAERLARGHAAPAPASAIPASLVELIGRGDELALIAAQLDASRLVTLLGPGGAGKTTLGLETARRRPPAVFVELAPAASGEVWDAVATALGRSVRLAESATPVETTGRERVLAAVTGRAVLLVLDNAEHVIDEAARVAADLLAAAPGVRLLVTSREPLGVPGEAFVELGPLPDADAAALLGSRIRAARGTAPTAAEAPAVTRIARRLDGLPLALELAGAKARTLGIDELEAGLSDRFALLDRGPRTVEPRHQTLRAVIDWSWELLADAERRGLLALAVFPDGVGTDDARAVAEAFDVSDAVFDDLVDRSLVQRSRGRYRLLETVREYGADVLRRTGTLDAARTTQAAVLARLALAHDAVLRTPGVRRAIAWFDANEENLAAATRWCGDEASRGATGVELVRAQVWVWLMRERIEALRTAMERLGGAATLDSEAGVVITGIRLSFAAAGALPGETLTIAEADRVAEAAAAHPSELAALLPVLLRAQTRAIAEGQPDSPWSAGVRIDEGDIAGAPAWSQGVVAVITAAIAQNGGDVAGLGEASARALELFQGVGDIWGIALASQMRSEWLMLDGRLDEALRVADAASADLAGLTSPSDLLQQQAFAVTLLARLGRIDEARERLTQMAAVAREDGSDRAMLQAAVTAASLELIVGDGAAALAQLDLVPADLSRGVPGGGPPQILAWQETRRGQALVLLGRLGEAREHLRRGGELGVESGDQPIMADAALGCAEWLAAAGRADEARGALALAAALRGRADVTDPVVQRVRAAVGDGEGPDATASDPAALTALVARL